MVTSTSLFTIASAVAAWWVAVPDATADCALVGLVAKPLNDGATISPDGGIVVAAVPEVNGGSLSKGDAALITGWLTAAHKAPSTSSLAPGLAVYTTDQLVTGDTHAAVAKVTIGGARERLAAPRIKAVVYQDVRDRRSNRSVVVTLDGDAPADAIAIVLADAKGNARSWGPITDGNRQPGHSPSIVAFHSRDCLTLANGTVPSKAGDLVQLWFVDRSGRVGARSAARKITAP